MNATVCQRAKFIDLIAKEPKLEHIEIAHWAGLGGISYLPPEFRPEMEEIEVEMVVAVAADQEVANNNTSKQAMTNKQCEEGDKSVRTPNCTKIVCKCTEFRYIR